jgi:hypothetical protein
MKRYIVILLFSIIIAMPVWIRAVSLRPWQPLTKMVLITAMVLFSTGFSIYVFLKPYVNPSVFTVWVGNIALALYFVVVMVSAYFSWPR